MSGSKLSKPLIDHHKYVALGFDMSTKFHIAMFCSDAAYAARKAFYTAVFGVEPSEGDINDGAGDHSYWGSKWDRKDGFLFALLRNSALTGSEEKLAHVGFMFDSGAEFDAEIQKRDIDTRGMRVYPEGQRQVFVQDENGVEWEFACTETTSP